VHVGGVPAYSTLGWFDDPLLSSFIRYPDLELARLVFHELAHQVAYAKDDSTFNESFAVAVEEAGLMPLDRVAAAGGGRQAPGRPRARRAAARRVPPHRPHGKAALAAAYATDADVEAKRRAKRDAFEAMRVAYVEAKGAEPGMAAFDRWFAGDGGRGPNNASLVSMGLYSDNVPAFRACWPRSRRRPAALLRPGPRPRDPAQGRAPRRPGGARGPDVGPARAGRQASSAGD
jgi:predicted aminopeptidase